MIRPLTEPRPSVPLPPVAPAASWPPLPVEQATRAVIIHSLSAFLRMYIQEAALRHMSTAEHVTTLVDQIENQEGLELTQVLHIGKVGTHF